MERDDLQSLKNEVNAINWWHSIELGNGITTPGRSKNLETLKTIHLPDSFENKTVIDIGAWDGFYSFEAEKRGANRVLAVDSYCWSGESWGSKDGFNFARKVLGSKVEDKFIEVLDISPETTGIFDVVLFLGVLYHMKHPLLSLEKVFSITKELLILETAVDLSSLKVPAMRFYPDGQLNSDPSNWWGPNPLAVVCMLKNVGFSKVEIVSDDISLTERIPKAFYRKIRFKEPLSWNLQRGRIVVHAYK
jgi:tRNA (mo5U34)-methyltransferase